MLDDFSSKFWPWTEVEDEPHSDISCSQIVQQLGFMSLMHLVGDLQFHENNAVNQQVGEIVPYHHPVVSHLDGQLLGDVQPPPRERNRHGVLVNLLQEAIPKLIIDFVKSFDNLLRYVAMQEFVPHHYSARSRT